MAFALMQLVSFSNSNSRRERGMDEPARKGRPQTLFDQA
jgi:hypothetical protein